LPKLVHPTNGLAHAKQVAQTEVFSREPPKPGSNASRQPAGWPGVSGLDEACRDDTVVPAVRTGVVGERVKYMTPKIVATAKMTASLFPVRIRFPSRAR
jgi:hypothetical protein